MKKKKVIRIAAAVAFHIFVLAMIVNFYVIATAQRSIRAERDFENDGRYDCVVVLGCGVKPDGTASDMLRERVQKGCEVFRAVDCAYLFLTGDGNSRDEPGVMKKLCVDEFGIDEDKIITDGEGYSTYESIINASNSAEKVKRVIIVTQSYHLPRALFIARNQGLEAVGCEAHLLRYKMQVVWSIREFLARNKDFVKCMLEEISKGGLAY